MPRGPSLRRSRARSDTDWQGYRHPAMDYQPPTLLKRVNATLTLAVAMAVAAGLWAFAWYATSSYLKAQVTGWVEAQGERGAIAGYETLETSGFPARVVVTLTKPRYAGPLWTGANAPGIDWQGESLTLTTRVWTPWTVEVQAPGRHDLSLGGGAHRYSGTAQDLRAVLNPGDGLPEQLALTIRGLTLGGAAPLGVQDMTLDLNHDASVTGAGTGLTLDLSARELTLPLADWGLDVGLGQTLRSLETSLNVRGPVQPGPLKERLETWRAVGGALEVQSLKARLNAVALATTGTLALDEDLQPVGAFTAKFEGLFQALEILRRRGIVDGGDAVVATMALAALSKRPAGGGAPFINLAVGVQGGKVTLGPVKILDLPHFTWGPKPTPEPQPVKSEPVRDFKDAPPVY